MHKRLTRRKTGCERGLRVCDGGVTNDRSFDAQKRRKEPRGRTRSSSQTLTIRPAQSRLACTANCCFRTNPRGRSAEGAADTRVCVNQQNEAVGITLGKTHATGIKTPVSDTGTINSWLQMCMSWRETVGRSLLCFNACSEAKGRARF